MRLINTDTLLAEEFIGSQIPKYAILSHTWEADEASFADLRSKSLGTGHSAGVEKVRRACSVARKDGDKYTWVDTCCIDKSSSSELTEAINSMFRWYEAAEVCHVYLSDLGPDDSVGDIGKCRWFTRGWTLQELVAPKTVKFYNQKWKFCGTKRDLLGELVQATSIPRGILRGRDSIKAIPVAARMSWAANRTTTREEDIAYCLLGIFDVNMPLIYGEGRKAFLRLQEEIIRQTNDLTIFYWRASKQGEADEEDTSSGDEDDEEVSWDEDDQEHLWEYTDGEDAHGEDSGVRNDAWGNVDEHDRTCHYRGVLADSPSEFKCASSLTSGPHAIINLDTPEFTITNKGIRITMPLIPFKDTGLVFMYLVPTRAPQNGSIIYESLSGILLKRYGDGLYARASPTQIPRVRHRSLGGASPAQRYLTKVIGPETMGMISPSLMNSCKFQWQSDGPYEYVSTTPSAWWDSEQSIFRAGSNSDFVAWHLFRSSWEAEPKSIMGHTGYHGCRFILVFGISKGEKAWFYVWKEGSYEFRAALEREDLGAIQELGELAFDELQYQGGDEYDTQLFQLFKPQTVIPTKDQTNTLLLRTTIQVSLKSFTSVAGWQVEIKLNADKKINKTIYESSTSPLDW